MRNLFKAANDVAARIAASSPDEDDQTTSTGQHPSSPESPAEDPGDGGQTKRRTAAMLAWSRDHLAGIPAPTRQTVLTLADRSKEASAFLTSNMHEGGSRIAEQAVALTSGLQQFAQGHEVCVGDHLIERKLVPLLEDTNAIEQAVIFGYRAGLRCQLVVRWKGVLFEAHVDLTPTAVSWGPDYTITFDYQLSHWETLNAAATMSAEIAKEAVFSLIPFGGLIRACTDMAVDRLVKDVGLAHTLQHCGLDAHGVSITGQQATVDLREQRQLAVLWQPPLPEALMSWLPGNRSRLADLFTIASVRADRRGLHLGVQLTSAGDLLAETAPSD